MTASGKCRNLVKDFLFLYARKTHQSMMVHTPIKGNEDLPFLTGSGSNTFRALKNKEAVQSPCIANKPVVHGIIFLLQLRPNVDVNSPKFQPFIRPVQVGGTTMNEFKS